MTPVEWAKCVLVLRASYGHSFKLDEAGIDIWFGMLQDLPGERVMAAVAHMVKSQSAFPSIADIRKLAEPAPADPGEAWREACEYVGRLTSGPLYKGGEVHHVVKPEPWVMAAIEAVGTDAIRQRTPSTEGTLRAHFVRFYEARLQHERLASSGLRVLDGGRATHIGALLPEVKP